MFCRCGGQGGTAVYVVYWARSLYETCVVVLLRWLGRECVGSAGLDEGMEQMSEQDNVKKMSITFARVSSSQRLC